MGGHLSSFQMAATCAPTGEYRPPKIAGVDSYSDLFEYIEKSQTNCLNQKDEHTWEAMLKGGDDDQYCESNVDEQLLLNIGFREKVKIKGIVIKGAAGKEDEAPSDIKLFVNAGALGFGDVDDKKPAQVIELSAEEVENGSVIDLQFVRFQNVQNISVFVERNHGDADTSILNRLQLIGCPILGTNMNDLKKVG